MPGNRDKLNFKKYLIAVSLALSVMSLAYGKSIEQLDLEIAESLNNRNFSQAQKLALQAMEATKKTYGKHSIEVLKSLDKLMIAYYMGQDFAKAEDVQKNILGMVIKIYGRENLDVLRSLKNLEKLNLKQGKRLEAQDYHTQVAGLGPKLVSELIKDPEALKQPRVLSFIPTLYEPLPLELAIPDNYTVMPDFPDFNLNDGVFWGQKKTLEVLAKAFPRDTRTIDTPVFHVKVSANVYQTGPDKFSGEDSGFPDLKNVKSYKVFWGDFPVLVVEGDKPDGTRSLLAWVGMNDSRNREVLYIAYYYPIANNKKPSGADLKTWDNFIKETTVFPEPQYSLLRGFDYQDGYTIVTRGEAKFKVSAQRRKRDGKCGILIENQNDYASIEFQDAEDTKGAVEVKLIIFQRYGDSKDMLSEFVRVTPREVDEFVLDGEITAESRIGPVFFKAYGGR